MLSGSGSVILLAHSHRSRPESGHLVCVLSHTSERVGRGLQDFLISTIAA